MMNNKRLKQMMCLIVIVVSVSGCKGGIGYVSSRANAVCLGGVEYYTYDRSIAPVVDRETLKFIRCEVKNENAHSN